MLFKFIEQLRKKHKLTQEYMAKELGVSRPTYIQIAKGERDLTVFEAQKIAQLFDLTFDDLVHEREQRMIVKVMEAAPEKFQREIRISVPQEKIEKFKQVLLYILKKVGGKPNVGMTTLYKLLYFIDFDYYEKYEEQLLGLRYIKNHYGPTPMVFKKIIDDLISENLIDKIKCKYYHHQQTKYLINPELRVDLSLLNGNEKEHIDWELDRLSNMSASKLSEFSHHDVPWMTAEQGAELDYEAVFYRTSETSVREDDVDED